MAIKAVVFDFDGVILPDSQHAKDSAYLKLFPGDEKRVQSVLPQVAARYAGGKGDRIDIVRDLASAIGKKGITDTALEALIQKFSTIIRTEIDAMVPLPQTFAMLQILSGRLPLYIASATPEKEMKERLLHLKLDAYFVGVYGRPHTKVDAVHAVVKKERVTPEEVVIVGDMPGDQEAAKAVGTKFIGVKNAWNLWPSDMDTPMVSALDLQALIPIIARQ